VGGWERDQCGDRWEVFGCWRNCWSWFVPIFPPFLPFRRVRLSDHPDLLPSLFLSLISLPTTLFYLGSLCSFPNRHRSLRPTEGLPHHRLDPSRRVRHQADREQEVPRAGKPETSNDEAVYQRWRVEEFLGWKRAECVSFSILRSL